MEHQQDDLTRIQHHLNTATALLEELRGPPARLTAEEQEELAEKRQRAAYARLWNPRLCDDVREEMLDELRMHGCLPAYFDETDLPWDDEDREQPDPCRKQWIYEAAPLLGQLTALERTLWLMHRLARMTPSFEHAEERLLDLWDALRRGDVVPRTVEFGLRPPFELLSYQTGGQACSATQGWYPHYAPAVDGSQWTYPNGSPVHHDGTWFSPDTLRRWGGRLGQPWAELVERATRRRGADAVRRCHIAAAGDQALYTLGLIELEQ